MTARATGSHPIDGVYQIRGSSTDCVHGRAAAARCPGAGPDLRAPSPATPARLGRARPGREPGRRLDRRQDRHRAAGGRAPDGRSRSADAAADATVRHAAPSRRYATSARSPSTPTATPRPQLAAPRPTASPAATPAVRPPRATAAAAVVPSPTAILDGYEIVGRDPEFSADGRLVAFSARPVDHSTGPDVFVWRSGRGAGTAVTSAACGSLRRLVRPADRWSARSRRGRAAAPRPAAPTRS